MAHFYFYSDSYSMMTDCGIETHRRDSGFDAFPTKNNSTVGTPAPVICASETLHLCAGEVGLLRNEICQAKYDSTNTKRKL